MTIHGVPQLARAHAPQWLTAVWAGVIGCFMLLCLYMEAKTVLLYLEYRSVVNIHTSDEGPLLMPTVTICNFNTLKKSAVLEKYPEYYHILSGENADDQAMNATNSTWVNINSQRPILDGLLDMSFRLEDLLLSCRLKLDESMLLSQADCAKYFEPRRTTNGVCYSFHTQAYIDAHGPLVVQQGSIEQSVQFVLHAQPHEYLPADRFGSGFRVAVHDVGTQSNIDVDAVMVATGFQTFIGLQRQTTQRLSTPYASTPCLDNSDLRDDKYSVEECNFNCTLSMAYDCGDCSWEAQNCTMRHLPCITSNLANNVALRSRCSCPRLCRHSGYDKQVSSIRLPHSATGVTPPHAFQLPLPPNTSIADDIAIVHVYFRSTSVTTTEHVPAMNVQQLFAQIGGQLGLFLGASFVSCTECVEMIVVVIARRVTRRWKTATTTTAITNDDETEKPPKY